MANIKELKKKIKSTKGTLKITSAMKLVSAAKLAKAQVAIQNSRPYSVELEETVKVISALVQDYTHPYLEQHPGNKKAILLVISADRGLCGGYNSNLAKEVRKFLEKSKQEIEVHFIGRKVKEIIEKEVNAGKTYTFEKPEPTYEEIQEVGKELGDMYAAGELGTIYVAYNVFQSALVFTPTIKQLLPICTTDEECSELRERFPFDFLYQPDEAEILDKLIPDTYDNTLYTCILDAVAAEHGARMTSMDSASNNCEDAIRVLTLKMNKLRQAAITTELIEVVSGAESLES